MKILLKNIWNKGKVKTPHSSPTQTIVLGFALFILLGACLLNLPLVTRSGHSVGFTNALFTSTSAVCVTGLVVVDTNTTFNLFGGPLSAAIALSFHHSNKQKPYSYPEGKINVG